MSRAKANREKNERESGVYTQYMSILSSFLATSSRAQ